MSKPEFKSYVKNQAKFSSDKDLRKFCKANIGKLDYLWFVVELIYSAVKFVQLVLDQRRNTFLKDYINYNPDTTSKGLAIGMKRDFTDPTRWEPYVQHATSKWEIQDCADAITAFGEDYKSIPWSTNRRAVVWSKPTKWEPSEKLLKSWKQKDDDSILVKCTVKTGLREKRCIDLTSDAFSFRADNYIINYTESKYIERMYIESEYSMPIQWYKWKVGEEICSGIVWCAQYNDVDGRVYIWISDGCRVIITDTLKTGEIAANGPTIAISSKDCIPADLVTGLNGRAFCYEGRPKSDDAFFSGHYNIALPNNVRNVLRECLIKGDLKNFSLDSGYQWEVFINVPLIVSGQHIFVIRWTDANCTEVIGEWKTAQICKPLVEYGQGIDEKRKFYAFKDVDGLGSGESNADLWKKLRLAMGIPISVDGNKVQLGLFVSTLGDLVEDDLIEQVKQSMLKVHFKKFWKRYLVVLMVTVFGTILAKYVLHKAKYEEHAKGKTKGRGKKWRSEKAAGNHGKKRTVTVDGWSPDYADMVNKILAYEKLPGGRLALWDWLERQIDNDVITEAQAAQAMINAGKYYESGDRDHLRYYKSKVTNPDREVRERNEQYGTKVAGGGRNLKNLKAHADLPEKDALPEVPNLKDDLLGALVHTNPQDAADAKAVFEAVAATKPEEEVARLFQDVTTEDIRNMAATLRNESFASLRGNVTVGYRDRAGAFHRVGTGMLVAKGNTRYVQTAKHVVSKIKGDKVTFVQEKYRSEANKLKEVISMEKSVPLNLKSIISDQSDLCYIPVQVPDMQQNQLRFITDWKGGPITFYTNGSKVTTTARPSPSERNRAYSDAFGIPGDSGSPVFSVNEDGSLVYGVIGAYVGKTTATKPNVGVIELLHPYTGLDLSSKNVA